ncbi:glutamine--fructose-6-phosphate transaminase (isomerizing) [Maricaulis sp.]|uniref:glutamine--fructose-6-phosphate transaminase (isomerizing) n=1 Tax=Maricaulis sp. TaxID=1486257 RepID=UPI0025C63F6F|nr:glutamine--fructose-6-phosphate transaminase (isomerizing) [Maricaulis sp.]
MCGIVGVVGLDKAESFLLEGLRRLEYRGYDSAGLAVLAPDGRTQRVRAVGKVSALRAKIDSNTSGVTGIAHTRWATHGAATQNNAHPHQAGRVSLVHNGIIENFMPLRRELEADGRQMQSETDTEVIAHLIDRELGRGLSPRDALCAVMARLEGAFALGVMIDGEPDLILGARKGAPLLVGEGHGSGYLASDALALAEYAETLTFLEDGDLAEVRAGRTEIFNIAGQRVNRSGTRMLEIAMHADKGPYRHFMAKEIHEQPEVLARTLGHYIEAVEQAARKRDDIDFSAIARIVMIGCGTAAYAGHVAEYWFERLARIPAQTDIASEFRYRDPVINPTDLAIFISQSGETADTLEALRLCKAAGCPTVALVNATHSTMAREADIVLPILAGPEIGVASTKAFTCQLAALASIALLAAAQRGTVDAAGEQSLAASLLSIPGLVAEALKSEAEIQKLAPELSRVQTVLYLGRDQFFPIALEGALKLKEISYIHAEGYASGELKHGPLALVEDGVVIVAIAPSDGLLPKNRSTIEQVLARGSRVILITDAAGREAIDIPGVDAICLPAAGMLASPIIAAIAVQLIAYHVSVQKGTDVDQPRNLAKSVTVE